MHRIPTPSILLLAVSLAACGSDKSDEACDANANTGCDDGLTCERIEGSEETICAQPVVARGKVYRLADGEPVEGARVVALDVNGAPVSSVATTNATGDYELGIPSPRTADGAPIAAKLTLRADASGYLTFPSGVRQALPIDTASAVVNEGKHVVQSALTDVGLILQPDGAGAATIGGTVEVPASRAGVLVVAEFDIGQGVRGISAIADTDGSYRIFNLPAATHRVTAYARGVNYVPQDATVAAGEAKEDVNLEIDEAQVASTVTGSVNIVNPEGGIATSVILVLASTFNENLARGEAPPGLRAPDPGILPNINGAFTISGVPAGHYKVLAAFENDDLVRDPSSIGGTEIIDAQVVAGQDLTLPASFKVTGSLDVFGPGVNGPEAVTEAPVLHFSNDSSADAYDVFVYDARGTEVWTYTHTGSTNSPLEILYTGPLDAGMYYQFRAFSRKGTGAASFLSSTEDLRGVFYLE